MKRFAHLFNAIDQSAETTAKVAALADYVAHADPVDKLWTVALFSGKRPKRAVTTTCLREWATAAAGIPLWLFEESHAVVGDLVETIGLVLPPGTAVDNRPLAQWINDLRALAHVDDVARKAFVLNAWQRLDGTERFLFNKLLTGGLRLDLSQPLMIRALAQATGKPETELAHRLAGNWEPVNTTWHALIEAEDTSVDTSRPYPFHLAFGLENGPPDLGGPDDWRAEWKWDGVRVQLVLRKGACFVWSRSGELMTDRFPELARAIDCLPAGTVLDGEVLVWHPVNAKPSSFNALQARITRKTVPRKLLQDAPVVLQAYDLLEWQGTDIRNRPFAERRALLEAACAGLPLAGPIRLSPQLSFDGWDTLAALRGTARVEKAEGVMLKRADSPYQSGRKEGGWRKWKLDPLTIDAVMIYAQSGTGSRAGLFDDFTFAVWTGTDLVPVTKARSGLTDGELREITAWVSKNTVQRFGPVRQVTPHHVFEISFDGIQPSNRNKSGVALRLARMKRWRRDKSVQDANTLDDLNEMLRIYG